MIKENYKNQIVKSNYEIPYFKSYSLHSDHFKYNYVPIKVVSKIKVTGVTL